MTQTVLLADASPDSRRASAEPLVAAGYRVLLAEDAIQAMSAARNEQPDLIVADFALPGGGGSQFLFRLFSLSATTLIPVLSLTNTEWDAKTATESGARGVLTRPFEAGQLLSAVAAVAGHPGGLQGAPSIVLNDATRLAAVRQLGALDTSPEESFDRITRLAARLIGAPVSLISMIDSDRQFFKSQVGLAEPWATARQTDLSRSFCQYVVTFREPFVVDNAPEHPLVASNRAIPDLGVIAYAGVPIIDHHGNAIGSLCAIDSKPRHWSAEDIATLTDLSGILLDLLELRVLAAADTLP